MDSLLDVARRVSVGLCPSFLEQIIPLTIRMIGALVPLSQPSSDD
jgi:hypothetical protein